MGKSLAILAALVAAAAFSGCATTAAPPSPGGARTITVAPERVAQCATQGGCLLLTQQELLEGLAEAYELGLAEGGGRKGGGRL